MTTPAAGSAGDEGRRQRLDRIFGDVLPETTEDERGPGRDGPGREDREHEADLRRDVPPHHG